MGRLQSETTAAAVTALQRAAQIDRLADHLLAVGRHIQAEMLAHSAAALRQALRRERSNERR
jgi:hypothetical protein